MERVLEELKKIEDEAEKIRLEASEEAKEIISLARQGSERLIIGAEKEAEEAVSRFVKAFEISIRKKRDEIIKRCESQIDKLRKIAKKKKDSAVNLVFKVLIGEKQV